MIHNAFLIRVSTKEILASEQYWPVEVTKEQIEEYIKTREELMREEGGLEELPLIIGESKFIGRVPYDDLIVVLVTDKAEDEKQIETRVAAAATAVRNRIKKVRLERAIESFSETIETSIVTRLKIALVGEGGTGKTTTLHLLLGDTPPLQYVPTIALSLETIENIRFGNYSLVLWDFAGQERFRNLWKFYFHGADVIIIVCDSTLRNVIISKDILKLIRRDAPKVPIFALANKQDKPNAMRPEVIQKILGVPTYPMVAIDKSRRDEMLRILMNAAAQYVGVSLPDLPASELLRFTEMKEVEEIEEEEVEEAEEIEEVYEYVDEDGKVIEDLGEYEIVEEFEEEEEIEVVIEEDVEEEIVMKPPPEEVVSPETVEDEPEEVIVDVLEDASEDIAVEVEDEPEEVVVDVLEDASEDIAVEVEDEDVKEVIEAVEIETPSEMEEPVIEVLTTDAEDDVIEFDVSITEAEEADIDGGARIAIDLISEALDADEIIVAEIERASRETLDGALEAFSCEEAMPEEGEEITLSEVDDDVLSELESILGALDSMSTPVSDSDESETTESYDEESEFVSIEDLIPALDYDAVEEASEEEIVSIVIEEFSDDEPIENPEEIEEQEEKDTAESETVDEPEVEQESDENPAEEVQEEQEDAIDDDSEGTDSELLDEEPSWDDLDN